MSRAAQWTMPILFLLGAGTPASADVITDWNEKAVCLGDEAPDAAAAGRARHRLHACRHV